MGFYVQDAAKFLINPLVPAFVFLLIMLVRRHRSRWQVFLFILYLYAVSVPATARIVMGHWWVPDTVNRQQQYDAAIVLGGIVNSDWYVAHRTKEGREVLGQLPCYHHLGESADRILMGVAVVKTGLVQKLLISDVTINGVSETEILLDFLRKQGIDEQQFVVHEKVRNTLAEARSIKKYCDQHGVEKILLITSANHMRRAAAFFRKEDLAPDLLSVSRYVIREGWEDLIPSAKGLNATYDMLYEVVGYGSYFLLGKL